MLFLQIMNSALVASLVAGNLSCPIRQDIAP